MRSEFAEANEHAGHARLEGQRWVPARRASPALAIARGCAIAALILAAGLLARAVLLS